jgi:ubiquinone/menaquinone biosynthesis C-methylase UbiE
MTNFMNLEEYRQSPNEQLRIENLMNLIPEKGSIALDVGARDGYLSIKLTEYFAKVVAVDLEQPQIIHDRVESQQGDITQLGFSDNSLDLVLCSEVLEHIPSSLLVKACSELARVSKKYLIIGVPYKQDLRFGRTTCLTCHKKNPPWGHVNKFDEAMLKSLFPNLKIEKIEFVGVTKSKTNFLSSFLMDLAGNPYGTYSQDEVCVHCNNKLIDPKHRNLYQKCFTRLAVIINDIQQLLSNEQANWIHVLFKKCN